MDPVKCCCCGYYPKIDFVYLDRVWKIHCCMGKYMIEDPSLQDAVEKWNAKWRQSPAWMKWIAYDPKNFVSCFPSTKSYYHMVREHIGTLFRRNVLPETNGPIPPNFEIEEMVRVLKEEIG